jgi:hypothetical protein
MSFDKLGLMADFQRASDGRDYVRPKPHTVKGHPRFWFRP